jgi:hypothetical protein
MSISWNIEEILKERSHGSSVNITTRLGAERPGLDSRQGMSAFLLAPRSRLASGPTQPQSSNYQSSFSRDNAAGA